ncbi:FlgB family protein [Xinfangfangia sp. D13-10-4-6]|uniref:FlgB family protein n=1 Tax=Pseudogemmobacter hezensis TaxID=2737662 RepID=UPI001557627D|nr:FlgB family protein [Pseudogemmobacter hezensis]NPD16957.1 FlgB family protein [Pseudogemmobacter hezensis]
MFAKLELTRMSQNLAAYSGARMDVIARNVANADTPGYRARDLESFSESYGSDSTMRATRAKHLGAAPGAALPEMRMSGGAEAPNGNDVSIEMEMVKSASARQDHEMALAIYRATSGVIRASLGRNS